ncbi:YtxH domain-containing protein [Flavobacterium sp. xlx-214]|uniref:YtxH domain-containing protein n=1 Tax=unclassified Flavobacterium TaxID=196869 RepID=UPI0013D6A3BF|nr:MULTISPECIES: YtxH domain-containing protein [unclassified Flavobacterium]MBA5793444.1 YtxH domain-containing protein [Flavobacterium sp. xlx-221]QMI82784.1 YtxH domain-containing protein [Flavobacterium sp. xlx-214]
MIKSKKSIAIIVAGAVVGAAVCALLAPEEGKQIRNKLGKGLKCGSNSFMSSFEGLKEMVLHLVADKKGTFENNFDELVHKTEHKKEDIISSLERKLAELKKK